MDTFKIGILVRWGVGVLLCPRQDNILQRATGRILFGC